MELSSLRSFKMAVSVSATGDPSAMTGAFHAQRHHSSGSSSNGSGSGVSSTSSVAGSPTGRRDDDDSIDNDINDDDDAPRSVRSDASSRSSVAAAAAIREAQLNLPLDKEFVPLEHHDEDDHELEATATRDEMRDDVIRMIFDLPDTTTFYQDYSCAIAGTFAMHGRMYPTSSHVCFYSNVFGRERKILIPYESIATITKTTTMMFQHAIRLATTAKDEYTFTSFWGANRDACYDLIVKTRSRVVHELKPALVRSLKLAEADAGTATSPLSTSSANANAAQDDETDAADSDADVAPPDAAAPHELTESEGDRSAPSLPPSSLSTTATQAHAGNDDEVFPQSSSPALVRCVSVVSDIGSAAPRDISMTQIVETTFSVSADDFLNEFFWDGAPFGLDTFGAQQGYTEMKVNPWMTPLEDDSAIGKTRSLQFRVPVDAPIGPKSSQVDVLQCASMDTRGVHVIETSTRLVDIPYGDYFSVEDRWTLVPSASTPPSCTLFIELKVVFSKSTFWKGKIEARAIADNKTKWCKWVECAKQHLAAKLAQGAAPAAAPEAAVELEPVAHQSSADSKTKAADTHSQHQSQKLTTQSSSASTRSTKRRSSRATSSSHRSRGASRAADPSPSFLLYFRVFPWILVLVLLFLVIRMQSSLATIEHTLVVATAKMDVIESQLASLTTACPASF